jgi:hypothetical protein
LKWVPTLSNQTINFEITATNKYWASKTWKFDLEFGDSDPQTIPCSIPDANVWELYDFWLGTWCFVWNELEYTGNWLTWWIYLNKQTWILKWLPMLWNNDNFKNIPFSVIATDKYWLTISSNFLLKITNKFPELISCNLPAADWWVYYNFSLWEDCFIWDDLTYIWNWLTWWINLNPQTWDIKWLPIKEEQTINFEITATNKYWASTSETFELEIIYEEPPENSMSFNTWTININEWEPVSINISSFLQWNVWDFMEWERESQKFSMNWLPGSFTINENNWIVIWDAPEIQWGEFKEYNFNIWVNRVFYWISYKAFWTHTLKVFNNFRNHK